MVKIKYNGSTIASLEAGQTARLHTKDTSLDGDIIITVPADMGGGESAEPKLITFTMQECCTETYKLNYLAEEGMTFRDWVQSIYNTSGWRIIEGEYLGGHLTYDDPWGSPCGTQDVYADIVIEAGRQYSFHAP